MFANSILAEWVALKPEIAKAAIKIEFRTGETVVEPDAPITHVLFPSRGLLCVSIPLAGGEKIEVGLCGYRGVVGGSAALGASRHLTACLVQMSGVGWSVPSRLLVEASEMDLNVRRLFLHHEQFLLIQAQQRAACNASHSIQQRFATRLLRVSDWFNDEEIHFTQEEFASSLGVQRASISAVASKFKDGGLIDYKRGRVWITDDARLLSEACECCAVLRMQSDRLLPKAGSSLF